MCRGIAIPSSLMSVGRRRVVRAAYTVTGRSCGIIVGGIRVEVRGIGAGRAFVVFVESPVREAFLFIPVTEEGL